MIVTDAEREQRIEQLGHSLVIECRLVERARMWREMRELIMCRSAEQVARMEQQKGLT